MEQVGKKALIASNHLLSIDNKKKNSVLKQFSIYLKIYLTDILKENKKDILKAKKINSTIIERLELSDKKIYSIRKSIREIIKFKNPVGKTISSWKRPNGLTIKKVSIPIGVIGAIYESRPNVTADISALCFKTGNVVILRGGSEAFYSNKILSRLFRKALKKKNCNENCVQFIDKTNRNNVDYLLENMKKYVDVIIPRGGKSLVKKVKEKSKVPTIGHLEGICHVYVDKKANLDMAIKIVKNAKLRNFSICGAAETLLIDRMCIKTHCTPILKELENRQCKIIGDAFIKKNFFGTVQRAKDIDWDTEYLSATISVKCVNGVEEAIQHINKHGTSHTDAIITNDKRAAKKFLEKVNSAIIVHNASTQFADGGEFGFGAEVGISTEKLHPRGPVGLEQLTTYKYILQGKGQIRK
ncbi:MAG: glutamate-5-semialdehyde dehydrogenase [Pelagibacterales bacterium]|nr:glutamate-5-semialdehyde dehydrogenase [Pelagibacterales bacterium]